MTFSVTSNIYDPLLALRLARTPRTVLPASKDEGAGQESSGLPVHVGGGNAGGNGFAQAGTRLVSETQEDMGDGIFRRTRTFEKDDGRRFTRLEEFSPTENGVRRAVIQENPSGTITRYEEVLDRQDAGGFRRTQRFQEGLSDIETTITPDYPVVDPYILSGGRTQPNYGYPQPFQQLRGTQLDLRT